MIGFDRSAHTLSTPHVPMFELRLLGCPLIEGPEGPFAGRASHRRQLSLLALLAVQGGRPLSRDKVLALLWPEASAERARHNLADTVYLIRKELGDDAVRSLGDDLLLDPDRVGSDVTEFESARAREDLVRAVETYGGPFLDGFHLPDSPAFEEWSTTERGRLGRSYLQSLEELAGQAAEGGDWTSAAEWLRRAAAAEPHNSRIAVDLARALAAAGDRAGALRRARSHMKLMREEYGAEPDPELEALAARLRAPPTGDSGDPTSAAAAIPSSLPQSRRERTERHVPATAPEPPDSSEGEAPRPSWRRPGSLTAALALLLIAAVGVLYMARGPVGDEPGAESRAVAPEKVLVLPFRTEGAHESLGYLHEGMVDLLAAKLTGQGGLLAVDPTLARDAWPEDRGVGIASPRALEGARRIDAGRVLSGSVVGTPELLTLHASILDARTGSVGARATAQGTERDIPDLVDRLAAELLSLSAGEEEHRVARLTTTSLPALRTFLEGRQAHRRGDYATAIGLYNRALDLDSTFALAGLGITQVSGWVGGSGPLSARGREVAGRHRDRLSERDRVGLEGRIAPRDPDRSPSVAERLEAKDRALQRWPDHPVLWYKRGDDLMHYGRTLGVADWAEEARLSFERAIELETGYAEPVHHLATMLRQLADTAALRRLITAQLRRAEEGPIADYFRWQAGHVWGEHSPFAPPALDSLDTDATLRWIGIVTQDYGFGIPDGRRAVRIRLERPGIPDERRERRLGALAWALNDGRPRAATRALESLSDVQPDPHFQHRLAVLTNLYADGDESIARSAASELAAAPSEGAVGELNACVLAQWGLRPSTDDGPDTVRPRRSAPSRLPTDRGAWAAHRAICWAVVDAQRARAERGAEGGGPSRALRHLDSLLAMGRHGGLVDSGHTEYAHLALARLFEARGDIPSALRALRRRSYYNGWQPYLAPILREEGRLAASVGDVEGAIRSYEHYLAFRTDPEPVLGDEVADVERQLDALRRGHRSR